MEEKKVKMEKRKKDKKRKSVKLDRYVFFVKPIKQRRVARKLAYAFYSHALVVRFPCLRADFLPINKALGRMDNETRRAFNFARGNVYVRKALPEPQAEKCSGFK